MYDKHQIMLNQQTHKFLDMFKTVIVNKSMFFIFIFFQVLILTVSLIHLNLETQYPGNNIFMYSLIDFLGACCKAHQVGYRRK